MKKKDPLEELRNRLQHESAESDRQLLEALRKETTDEELRREWDQLRGATPSGPRMRTFLLQEWPDVWAALVSRRIPQAAAFAAVLLVSLCVVWGLSPQTQIFAMSLPPLKGGPPPDPGRLVEASVKVSVNWKKQTLSIPLKAGGRLNGQFQRAVTNVSALPLVYNVSVTAVGARQPLSGVGQWVVMPRDADGDHGRLSAKAVLWTKLSVKLQAEGHEEVLYRVSGTP